MSKQKLPKRQSNLDKMLARPTYNQIAKENQRLSAAAVEYGAMVIFLRDAYIDAQQALLLADLTLAFLGGQALPKVAAEIEDILYRLTQMKKLGWGLEDFPQLNRTQQFNLAELQLRLDAIRKAKDGLTLEGYEEHVREYRGELWGRVLQFVDESTSGPRAPHTSLIARLAAERRGDGNSWRETLNYLPSDLESLPEEEPGRTEAVEFLSGTYAEYWANPNSLEGQAQFQSAKNYLIKLCKRKG